jgi:hypothetical protein
MDQNRATGLGQVFRKFYLTLEQAHRLKPIGTDSFAGHRSARDFFVRVKGVPGYVKNSTTLASHQP